jgi:formylglycine-generating enzyme required for sulfatase activity
VREWVEDLYNGNYYSNSPAADPTGPVLGQGGGGGRGGGQGRGGRGRGGAKGPGEAKGGQMRQLPVIRGGSFDNPANFVRFSSRYHYYGPTLRGSDIGFRAVREPIQ